MSAPPAIQSIIDLDAEIPDITFDFGVPEQERNSSEVARAAVDQGCLSGLVMPANDH